MTTPPFVTVQGLRIHRMPSEADGPWSIYQDLRHRFAGADNVRIECAVLARLPEDVRLRLQVASRASADDEPGGNTLDVSGSLEDLTAVAKAVGALTHADLPAEGERDTGEFSSLADETLLWQPWAYGPSVLSFPGDADTAVRAAVLGDGSLRVSYDGDTLHAEGPRAALLRLLVQLQRSRDVRVPEDIGGVPALCIEGGFYLHANLAGELGMPSNLHAENAVIERLAATVAPKVLDPRRLQFDSELLCFHVSGSRDDLGLVAAVINDLREA